MSGFAYTFKIPAGRVEILNIMDNEPVNEIVFNFVLRYFKFHEIIIWYNCPAN